MKYLHKFYLLKNAGILDDAKGWVGKNLGITGDANINSALGGAAAFVPGAIAGLATNDWRLPLVATLLGGGLGYAFGEGGPFAKKIPGILANNAGKLTGAGLGAAGVGAAYGIPASRRWLTGHSDTMMDEAQSAYAAIKRNPESRAFQQQIVLDSERLKVDGAFADNNNAVRRAQAAIKRTLRSEGGLINRGKSKANILLPTLLGLAGITIPGAVGSLAD